MKIGNNVAVVVAHPDDETLWAGGLLARYNNWDILCCSTPRRDPERVEGFVNAVSLLKHFSYCSLQVESPANKELTHLNELDLEPYDTIFTHNAQGEYGHVHHKQVHRYVLANATGKVYSFGFGKGKIQIVLTSEEAELKRKALECYSNKSSSDMGLPKWQALLNRYDIDFLVETYNEEC